MTDKQINNIIKKLNSEYISKEDISKITFYSEIIKYGNTIKINKHINIDFTFGDYIELHESEELYKYIFNLCNLCLSKAEDETTITLYQKENILN